jgi:hypothetical protein
VKLQAIAGQGEGRKGVNSFYTLVLTELPSAQSLQDFGTP